MTKQHLATALSAKTKPTKPPISKYNPPTRAEYLRKMMKESKGWGI